MRAACTVLYRSMVIVIGPTPPGTGVIFDATPRTASKSTSPTSLPSASRFIPTSTTPSPALRPGRDHVGLQDPRLPDGHHDHVGLARQRADVAAAAVADGDGGVGPLRLLHQDQRQRLADDVAAADDDDVGAVEGDAVA